MPPKIHLGVLAFLCLGLGASSFAQPTVTVRIATVQEEDWRRESHQGPPETLRDRLKAQTVIELHGGTVQDDRLVLRSGKEQSVVTEYDFGKDTNEVIVAEAKPEWIGTQVVVQSGAFMDGAKDGPLDIELTHDIAPPDSRPYQYATAAKGAERDKRTVAMPRLHRLHWKGEIPPDPSERAIASFQLENEPGTRLVVFFQGNFGQKTPLYEITQTIYRVPELEMIELMLATPWDDAAIIGHLEKARTAGRASIVSEVSTLAGRRLTGEMQAGAEHHVPTVCSPNYDLLYQLPASFEPVLAGTKLEFRGTPHQEADPSAKAADPADPFAADVKPAVPSGPRMSSVPGADFSCNSWFGSPGPLAVTWPTSWLRVHDRNYQPTGRAITGFMDWYDRFAQTIVTDMRLPDNTPHVVAVMPPADQVWGSTREGRWLDVTVARCQNHAAKVPAKQAAKTSSPWLVLGISLDSHQALQLLEKRGGKDDAELLRQLMQRVKEKTAHVRLCTAAVFGPNRHTLSSAREHVYPTEMPSIPSAWSSMLIGTQLVADNFEMSLHHDLAPPARMEWKLALDVPEAVMWEPSRRVISTHGAPPRNSGTHLCSAAAVPAILAGADMPAGETLLILMQRQDELDPAHKTEKPHAEIEALVFEVPAADADTWQAVKPDDFAAFTTREMDAGRARLSGHVLYQQRQGSEARLALVEEQMTATEFDPPEPGAPDRMRPTALETLPVGTSLETDYVSEGFHAGSIKVKLRHSIAKPVEPGLPETLKIASSGKEDYPGAMHLFSEWREQLMQIKPNDMRCLGVRRLPGNAKSVHIAYLRVREAR